LLLACALWCAPNAARAQALIAVGTEVRVTTTAGDCAAPTPCIGRWATSTPDSTVLDEVRARGRVALARATVTRLEVGERSRQRWTGALIGGALTAAAFVSLACSLSNGSCDVNSGNVGGFVGYVAVGALPGALIGGAIGQRIRGDVVWRQVLPAP
jgi:hypothetical protein